MDPERLNTTDQNFYRVYDDSSISRYIPGTGFLAGSQNPTLTFDPRRPSAGDELFATLGAHLDWSNRALTPFISVYRSAAAAANSAVQRRQLGKTNIMVAEIDYDRFTAVRGRVEFRKVRMLAQRLGLWVDGRTWANSEFEFVVLNWIPEDAVVVYTMDEFLGQFE